MIGLRYGGLPVWKDGSEREAEKKKFTHGGIMAKCERKEPPY